MKKEKMLIVSVVLMLAFSGCSNGADGHSAAENSVSTNKEETAKVADNVPEIKSGTSEEETKNEIVETAQKSIEETAEANNEEPNGTDIMEIDVPEVEEASSDTSESESAFTDDELPSTELCVGTAKEIFEQTNAERVAEGLPELVWSDELAEAADIRAEEIITEFSHVRPNGEKCYSLGSNVHGENIARGPHATGKEFVEHWMDSPGHKANILREKGFTAIGVGVRVTEMGDTAVQIFGTY